MLVEGPGGFPAYPDGWTGIYCFLNKNNGKVYIGKTVSMQARFASHMAHVRAGTNRHLYDAIRKHGIENFEFELIDLCPDNLADQTEKKWILHYGSQDPKKGYNMTAGGGGGDTFTKNPKREEIRLKYKARKWTDTQRVKMMTSLKNRPNRPSKPVSLETREKIRFKLLELGIKPPITILRGSEHPMYGKKHTQEAIKKMISAPRKKWIESMGEDRAKARKIECSVKMIGENNRNYINISETELLNVLISDPYIKISTLCSIFKVAPPTISKRVQKIFNCKNIQHFRATHNIDYIRNFCKEKL